MRSLGRFLTVLFLLSLLSVSAGSVSGDDVSESRPPRLLSETGLYQAPGTGRVASGNWSYSPQYPLWSDGAEKSRWIHLPPNGKIDASDPDSWEFPLGTKLWKEFRFGGRKVETRLIWRAGPENWFFVTYVWNEDQTDAVLAPEEGVPNLLEIAPGKKHGIPGVLDCKTCHENGKTPVLGFTALQLSTDRDPLAPHAETLHSDMITLQNLVGSGVLENSREDWLGNPPRIHASDPTARAALGYLATNCGVCHNSRGPLASLGLNLEHPSTSTSEDTEPGIATTIGKEGRYSIPGLGTGVSLRIDPGDPERSSIFYRMRSRRPSSQMPPLGSILADQEALELIRRWIAEDLARPGS